MSSEEAGESIAGTAINGSGISFFRLRSLAHFPFHFRGVSAVAKPRAAEEDEDEDEDEDESEEAEEPPGPASWGYRHRPRTAGKRPRVVDPLPSTTAGPPREGPPTVPAPPLPAAGLKGMGAASVGCQIRPLTQCSRCRVGGNAGKRARTCLRAPASAARNKRHLMGVLLLWPGTPHPLSPPLCCSLELMAMASAGGARRQRVLLVEDNEVNRVVVRRLMRMRELDLGLEEAENGKVAVDFVREGKTYDLILMDKEMPIMDGHEATRQLRSLGVKTPIVALSGNNLRSDMDLFLQAGADDFVDKPLSKDKFFRILAKFGLLHGQSSSSLQVCRSHDNSS